jgi:hypothetical protein
MNALQISARAGRFFRHHRAPKQLLVLVGTGTPRPGLAPIVPGQAPIAPIVPALPRHAGRHHARHTRAHTRARARRHHARHHHARRGRAHRGRRLAANGNLAP